MTDVRITQGLLEVIEKAGAINVLTTQAVVEVIAKNSLSGYVNITQGLLEIISKSTAATSVSGSLVLTVSGVVVRNAIGLKPLTVSAEWNVTGGLSNFTYQWLFEIPTGSSTSANITRSFSAFSNTPPRSIVSAFVSDAGGSSIASTIAIYLTHAGFPNAFDGHFKESNQPKRRVWPI
jgi:hypothetical protein